MTRRFLRFVFFSSLHNYSLLISMFRVLITSRWNVRPTAMNNFFRFLLEEIWRNDDIYTSQAPHCVFIFQFGFFFSLVFGWSIAAQKKQKISRFGSQHIKRNFVCFSFLPTQMLKYTQKICGIFSLIKSKYFLFSQKYARRSFNPKHSGHKMWIGWNTHTRFAYHVSERLASFCANRSITPSYIRHAYTQRERETQRWNEFQTDFDTHF